MTDDGLQGLLRDAVGWPVEPLPSTDEQRIEDLRRLLADRARGRDRVADLDAAARLELELRAEAIRRAQR